MKSVWILQTGEPIPGDPGTPRKLRAYNLAEKLAEKNVHVTIWTSRFNHTNKSHRESSEGYVYSDFIEVRFLESPGYTNNISLARLIDHFILALNFRKVLKKVEATPDLLFIGFPPIELAFIATKWAQRNSISTILDFKDLWPEIFLNVFQGKFKSLLKFLFSPFFYMSQFSISKVDALISISEPFLNKALIISGRKKTHRDLVIPLTTDNAIKRTNKGKEDVELIFENISYKKGKDHIISFAGTFMVDVFDFTILKDTLDELSKRGISLKIILAGDGQERAQWERIFSDCDDILFTGWVNQELLTRIQEESLAVLIPLKEREDFSLSIPNKAIDALSKGKIILTGTESFLSQSIQANEAGFKYRDFMHLSDIIESLISNKEKQLRFESNALDFYETEFEFNMAYEKLLDLMFSMTEEHGREQR